MADAVVERRPALRFFCHRCLVEFESVLQDYCCPFCQGGFVEQLEATADRTSSSEDFSDADMSNIDDLTDELVNRDEANAQNRAPMLDDLAFLMSGGRLRSAGTGSTTGSTNPGQGRRHTLMEELVWMIGGARPTTGAMTAGAPFVLVGAPGDYVFGGEGLDAVVTQLLGQLEQAGPPPLPQERLAELPTETVSQELAATNTACSVCWDNFSLGENVSKLECDHVFHSTCITPWLQLHATCPICRRSLLPEQPADQPAAPSSDQPAVDTPSNQPSSQPSSQPSNQPGNTPSNQPGNTPSSLPGATLSNPPGNTPSNPPRRHATLLSSLLGHQLGVQPPNQSGNATRPQIRIAPRMVIRRTAAGPVTVRRLPARMHAWTASAPPPPSAPPHDASPASGSAGLWAPRPPQSSNPPGSLGGEYNTDIDYD